MSHVARSPALRWQPLQWLAATSLAYITLYALANQLTSLRADVGTGVFAWEQGIPFIGWSIVPYLSICGFFLMSFFVDGDGPRLRQHVARLLVVLVVSVLCYAAFPLRFTFERPETHGLTGLLFDLLNACDLPYNRAPSLHIGVLVVLWARFAPLLRGWAGLALQGWFLLIAASVLTTYQHHVLDVPAGAALGLFALWVTRMAPLARAVPQRADSPRS
ncbi:MULTISPECIES: phosphatase PAP2 family protein [unclassified Roseateles]|uniref:phosphatase PAP2 family protein n=1 Tax=unclassified Roseateles TaxID=2626991 RepID=UPI0006FFB158|nr:MULTISPECIES: phosphatase PAP2 family protein [unclassified Roseateles]KQW43415.1 hypothetical protein ASC81_16700 [Pelomonas sp. Root405]KRA71153.1 hypothetical protein ASD88_15220 [Pelomonas sp. Root662]